MSLKIDPQEHLREVLQAAQVHLRVTFDNTDENVFGHHLNAYLGWATHAFLLAEFLEVDAGKASLALDHMQELFDTGSEAGVWLWHELVARGVDPEKLPAPSCCAPAVRPVLDELAVERKRQDAKWGEQNWPDGTSKSLAALAKQRIERTEERRRAGSLTWRDILEEELWESYAETDPAKLRGELVQSAAVLVAWIEAIDRRPAPWCCAKCKGGEESTGGLFAAICVHVADGGEEVEVFTDRRPDGFDDKYCGDRSCPTVQICIGCWDNLYEVEGDAAWWPLARN